MRSAINSLRTRLRLGHRGLSSTVVQLEGVRLRCSGRKRSLLLMKMEAPPGFEPGMEVLQTSALPLGYGADRTRRERQTMRKHPRTFGSQGTVRLRRVAATARQPSQGLAAPKLTRLGTARVSEGWS